MISEQKFSNIFVYIYIILSTKISTNPGLSESPFEQPAPEQRQNKQPIKF